MRPRPTRRVGTSLTWILTAKVTGIVTQRIDGFTSDRDLAEREAIAAGVALAVPQRAVWLRVSGETDTTLLLARERHGTVVAAAGIGISISRALPGHRIYRLERYGEGPSPDGTAAVLAALAAAARKDSRCLRAVVAVFERDASARQRIRDALVSCGFSPAPEPRMYTHTRALELRGTEEEIFAGINKTARSNVRAPAKRGLVLRPITDPALADRLAFLLQKSFARTDGTLEHRPWQQIFEFSAANPTLSRVVGLFDPTTAGVESVVSFAWGCAHGSNASYEAGAAARRPDLGSTPLSYAPLWDLIVWAREQANAQWFDLGGASATAGDQRFSGIDNFKRYFSDTIVEVGEEWMLEPRAFRAAVARGVGAAAQWVRARVRPRKDDEKARRREDES